MRNLYKLCKLISAIILCVLFQSKFAAAQVQTARPGVTIDAHCHGFYEYLPKGYSTGSQNFPIIIFLHGLGEEGDGSAGSLPAVLRNGPPKLINNGTFPQTFNVNGQSFSFIVISPQFTTWPSQTDVLDVVNYALAHYRVDRSRIYLTGLSMGGGSVWDFASSTSTPTNGSLLAAIVPISGAASPTQLKANQMVKCNLPVWALHNQNDPTVTVQHTIVFIDEMLTAQAAAVAAGKAIGPVPRKTIFPASGHDAWTKAYDPNYRENNMNVYEWMLSNSRSGVPTNSPPIANAGADKTITLPTNSVTLAGTGSDADGTIKSYAWSVVSGPSSYSFSSTTAAGPVVSGLVAGTYTFRLTVTDNGGSTGYDDVVITVNAAANKAPVANAGADASITLPTSSITLAGSGTDADGSIKTYAWSKVSGPASYSFNNAAVSNPVVSGLVAGTYTFRLTVTDNAGATAYDDVIVTVNAAANKAPVANAGGDKSITLPTNSVTLAGTGTDADGTITAYAWTKTAGPATFTISNAAISNPTISGLVAGTYTFRLTVKDNANATAYDDVNIVVNPQPVSGGGGTTSGSGVINVNIYAGANPYADSKWNNWSIAGGAATNISSGTFKYSDGSLSSVSASLSQSTAVVDNGVGYPVYDSASIAPSEVLRYSSYSPADRTLTIAGLTAGKQYAVSVYSSRNANSGNSTIVKTGTQSKTVSTYRNFTSAASFAGLVPDASGKIVITLSEAGTYNYINGFSISESGTGTPPVTPPTVTKYLKVNIFAGANGSADPQWYNWNVGSGGVVNVVSPGLKYSDGSTSAVTATLSQSTAVTDNGVGYPVSGTVMAPKEVLRYTSYSTTKRTLVLSGLSTSKKYDIELYGSRNANTGNTTVYAIGTLSTSVSSYKNFTDAATFKGLTPDAQGRITVTISSGTTYNYLNGFVVTEGSTASGTSVSSASVSPLSTTVSADLAGEADDNGSGLATLRVSPNPAHDVITLEVNNSEQGNMQIQLLGLNGNTYQVFNAAKNQQHVTQTLSISDLPSGVYLVKVQVNKWSGVYRIVKY